MASQHSLTNNLSTEIRIAGRSNNNAHWLQAIFHAFPDLLFHLYPDGTISDYLTNNESSLNAPPADFLGKRMQDIMPAEAGEKIALAIERVNRSGEI
ncbi:MAG: hypothetical protein KKA65_06090, partial [Nanoarchaeota archaeon]|nr:hypothetical protein [Nanoarchaeota archaeon]